MMFFPSRNIRFKAPVHPKGWRKAAIGTWRSVGDPSIYGVLELSAEPALRYIEATRIETGQKITMTHFVGKAIAEVIRRHPEINSILRFGKIYPRENIDLFFLVAPDSFGKDLTGAVVKSIDGKSLGQVAEELNARALTIRTVKDVDFFKMKGILDRLPDILSEGVLWLIEKILYTFNLHVPAIGIPKDAFGSAMITSIGSLGLDFAFAPLVPFAKVPMMIAPGLIQKRLKLKDGAVTEERFLRICVTLDHRLIDGVYASLMARTLKDVFENPFHELKTPEPPR